MFNFDLYNKEKGFSVLIIIIIIIIIVGVGITAYFFIFRVDIEVIDDKLPSEELSVTETTDTKELEQITDEGTFLEFFDSLDLVSYYAEHEYEIEEIGKSWSSIYFSEPRGKIRLEMSMPAFDAETKLLASFDKDTKEINFEKVHYCVHGMCDWPEEMLIGMLDEMTNTMLVLVGEHMPIERINFVETENILGADAVCLEREYKIMEHLIEDYVCWHPQYKIEMKNVSDEVSTFLKALEIREITDAELRF